MYNLVPHGIRVAFQGNGIYQFTAESATGKTYLYKQAYKLYKVTDDIFPLTYTRGVDVINLLEKELQQHNVKIVLLDRFDLYVTKELIEYLERIRDSYIVVLDYKRSTMALQVKADICYIRLGKDVIDLYDYASVRR